jgi:hypothetical protein
LKETDLSEQSCNQCPNNVLLQETNSFSIVIIVDTSLSHPAWYNNRKENSLGSPAAANGSKESNLNESEVKHEADSANDPSLAIIL